MCRVLSISRSGFYAWLKRPESERKKQDRVLLVDIRVSHKASRKSYGSPRVFLDVRALGHRCGENRVARLMRLDGLCGHQKKKFRHTTDSNHSNPTAPNLLDQFFAATGPNQKWVADITYIPTKEGWLYLSTVMDLYSRKIIGWSMSAGVDRSLVLKSLAMAINGRQPEDGVLHHSDRGSQYASDDYQAALRASGFIGSMSRRGNCYDNAVMESFFHTLKVECVYPKQYATRSEARMDLFDWIETFYNRRRRHSSLDYISPVEFEAREARRAA